MGNHGAETYNEVTNKLYNHHAPTGGLLLTSLSFVLAIPRLRKLSVHRSNVAMSVAQRVSFLSQ